MKRILLLVLVLIFVCAGVASANGDTKTIQVSELSFSVPNDAIEQKEGETTYIDYPTGELIVGVSVNIYPDGMAEMYKGIMVSGISKMLGEGAHESMTGLTICGAEAYRLRGIVPDEGTHGLDEKDVLVYLVSTDRAMYSLLFCDSSGAIDDDSPLVAKILDSIEIDTTVYIESVKSGLVVTPNALADETTSDMPPTPVQETTTAPDVVREVDLNDMTREELHSLINRARAALQKFEIYAETDTVLLDEFGVKVIMQGYEVDGTSFRLNYIIENNSDQPLIVSADNSYLNGWDVYFTIYGDLEAGKKTMSDGSVYDVDKYGISSADDLETLEFIFRITDPETYQVVGTSEKVTVLF